MAYENIFKPNVKKYSIHGASGILVTPTHLCYAICAHICLMFTTNVPRTHMIHVSIGKDLVLEEFSAPK